MKQKMMTALLGLSLLYLGPCGVETGQANRAVEEDMTIVELFAEPTRHIGRVVTLQGVFQGWQVAQCQFPTGAARHPRTRSDWLIRDGAYCAYVTGGMPRDIDPINPGHLGRRIELEAGVVQGEDGQVYLKYRSSRRL